MSLLWTYSDLIKHFKYYRKGGVLFRPSPKENSCLAVRSLARDMGSVSVQQREKSMKEISVFASWVRKRGENDMNGSMTVEAALLLPLLLVVYLNLMSAVEMLRLHGNVQTALWDCGRQISVYAWLYKEAGEEEGEALISSVGGTLLADWAIRSCLVNALGEDYLDGAPLAFGSAGLNVLESEYLEEDDCIDITVTYQISPWERLAGVLSFRMCNRYYGRAWTGYDVENAEETEYVYVTEYGEVYHVSRNCSYLTVEIESLSLREVETRRNNSGSRYTPCQICGREMTMEDTVYITGDGNRYHTDIQCSGLKRVVRVMERSEAEEKYSPCSKCGG